MLGNVIRKIGICIAAENFHGRYTSKYRQMIRKDSKAEYDLLAGVLGFEPRYAGIKTPCLTAWRRPNNFKNVDYPSLTLKIKVID